MEQTFSQGDIFVVSDAAPHTEILIECEVTIFSNIWTLPSSMGPEL